MNHIGDYELVKTSSYNLSGRALSYAVSTMMLGDPTVVPYEPTDQRVDYFVWGEPVLSSSSHLIMCGNHGGPNWGNIPHWEFDVRKNDRMMCTILSRCGVDIITESDGRRVAIAGNGVGFIRIYIGTSYNMHEAVARVAVIKHFGDYVLIPKVLLNETVT